MNEIDYKDFWIQILKKIEPRVKMAHFVTWFQDTAVLEVKDGMMVVGVPNAYAKGWLENKLNGELITSIKEVDPTVDKVVVYATSEKFTNEIIEAIGKRSAKTFKDRYRNVDCLIIDDIQFLANKEMTQVEFFHTFNELYDNGKQIIISSDKAPKELKGLEQRLISRFEMGMIVDVQFPDFETRLAILQAKCREHQVLLPTEFLDFIAYNVHHSIRELEGVLMQAVAQYELEQITPTVRSVAGIMKKLNRGGEF